MGARIVARDAEGEIIATLYIPQLHVNQLVLAEIYALWRGLIFYMEIGLIEVVFEGDTLTVLEKLKVH